jgi:hypothetical protein
MAFRIDRLDTGPANVYLNEILTGTFATSTTKNIVGTGTLALTELSSGDIIYIVGELPAGLVVDVITDDTHFTVTTVASTTATGKLGTADINIGAIKGGIDLQISTQTYIKTIDQMGDTPVGSVISSREAKVTLGFAEWSLKNLRRAVPDANAIVTSGTGLSQKQRFEISASIGYDLFTAARQMRVKPILDGRSETTDWNKIWTFPLAAPTAETLSIKYEPKAQRPFMATFIAFPDLTVTPARICYLGDPTA